MHADCSNLINGVMDMDQFYLVLIGLFILAASFFAIGIYLSRRSKKKDGSQRKKPVSHPRNEAYQMEGFLEIARLLRDESSGALLLEEGGIVYRKAAELSHEQQQSLKKAVEDLKSFLELMPASQVEVPQPVADTKKGSTAPLSSRFKKASQTSTPAQVKPPSMNPVDIFTRAITSDVPKANMETKSITAQIDEILQERLVNTPLAERGVRLLDAPDGGVVVFVGVESYDGVNAVPDDEVRHAIKAAVAEWEKRNKQGR